MVSEDGEIYILETSKNGIKRIPLTKGEPGKYLKTQPIPPFVVCSECQNDTFRLSNEMWKAPIPVCTECGHKESLEEEIG